MPPKEKMREDLRGWWEARWSERRAEETEFYMSEPPAELRALLEQGSVTFPVGAALDLGCGAGFVTAYLSRFFHSTVGVDIALSAVQEARRRADETRIPSFAVADARSLPFLPGSFGFIFDRGCLQQLPRTEWESYLEGVDRLLASGGMFHLFVSKEVRKMPPIWSKRGMGARVRNLLRSERLTGPQFLSRSFVTQLMPAALEPIEVGEFPFRTATGKQRVFIHGLFRKADR